MEHHELQLRETWLDRAASFLIEYMVDHGLPRTQVRVSCGWPSRGGLHNVVGECASPKICEDGKPQIFINPRIADSIEVMGILLHELIHAAIGCQHGHRKQFSQAAKKVGLVGPPTVTRVGDLLKGELERYIESAGIYPHAAILAKKRVEIVGQPETEKACSRSRLRLYECRCQPPVKVRVASDHFLARCIRCQAIFHKVSMDS